MKSPKGKRWLKPVLLGTASVAIVVATFAYFLPAIANYGQVWSVVKGLSWKQIALLLAVTVVNLLTFAPPWMVALPGLSFLQAFTVTQASTALSIVVPAGIAAGIAGSFAVLRGWGFALRDITRAVTLTGLWNQFLNLSFPIIAVFLLVISHESTAALATVALVGVAILGIVIAGFVLVLVSARLARDLGDVAARVANWALAKIRRGPVAWGGADFERFRAEAGDFLERRWHLLTGASLLGTLTVFLVFVVSLRTMGVSAAQVSLVEAFAAWALVRLVGSIPITPAGIGVVELALTGTLIGFGGNRANVVAAVLVYRFLTTVPVVLLGLAAAFTWRRQRPHVAPASEGAARPAGLTPGGKG